MDGVFHKRHKVKLVKDLKQSSSMFRQSLVDITEVQNINKIFTTLKKSMSIQQRKVQIAFENKDQQDKPLQKPINQRIALYKKQQYQKRLNQKMKINISNEQNHQMQFYKTPMKKILNDFEKEKKFDSSSNYLGQLKHSQKELQLVKHNHKILKRVEVFSSNQFERKKILSVRTGLPAQSFEYPSLEECLMKTQKPKQKKRKQSVMVDEIEKALDEIYNSQPNVNLRDEKSVISMRASYIHNKQAQKQLYVKAKQNLNRSVKTSEGLLKTLALYINTKKIKRSQYNNLVDTWKIDKPMTNQLRRRYYEVVGEDKQKNIETYRNITQRQRQIVLDKFRSFYSKILQFVTENRRAEQDFPLTKYLCEKIRKRLQAYNTIEFSHIQDILKDAKQLKLKPDYLLDSVLKKIQQELN